MLVPHVLERESDVSVPAPSSCLSFRFFVQTVSLHSTTKRPCVA